MADKYVATHEGGWRNSKHRWQWTQTLTQYCGPIRHKAVDEIGTDDILAVLTPLWSSRSVTASRLRGRIERVLNAARALGHIDREKANPARWKGHLDELLAKPQKLTRGHHKAMTRRHARVRGKPSRHEQHGGAGVGVPDPDRDQKRRDARSAVG